MEHICQELWENSAAVAVMLLDRQWRELARAGAATVIDVEAVRSLADGEREAIGRLDGRHVHLSTMPGFVLVVLFDERTSLGLVRLRAKKACDQLERLS